MGRLPEVRDNRGSVRPEGSTRQPTEQPPDGVHLDLDGEILASIPADCEERAAERADLERRYGVALFGADALDEATPPEMEQWLYYAAGLKDSHAPLVEWETRQYEARLPDLAAVVAERVRDRLAEPFETLDPSGRALVGSLDFEVERYVRSRESTWSGVPVELQSGGFRLSVDVALDWVDDG